MLHAINNGVAAIEHGNLISKATAQLSVICVAVSAHSLLTVCLQDGGKGYILDTNPLLLWYHGQATVRRLSPVRRKSEERTSHGEGY